MPCTYVSEKLSHVWMREVLPLLKESGKGQTFWWKKYSFSSFSISALDPLLTERGLTPFWNLACDMGVNTVDPGIEAQLPLPLASLLHLSIPQPQIQLPPTHVPLLEAKDQLRTNGAEG